MLPFMLAVKLTCVASAEQLVVDTLLTPPRTETHTETKGHVARAHLYVCATEREKTVIITETDISPWMCSPLVYISQQLPPSALSDVFPSANRWPAEAGPVQLCVMCFMSATSLVSDGCVNTQDPVKTRNNGLQIQLDRLT